MVDSDQIEEFESEMDGILPESIDRRRFLLGTVATMSGVGMAGCIGGGDGSSKGQDTTTDDGGDGSDGDDGGDDSDGNEGGDGGDGPQPIWRYGWKAEPSYSIGFIAEERGYWDDEGITGPDVQEGFGSGDAAKRVGSGEEALGMASVFPIVTNYAEGAEYKVYGSGKARSQMGLIYNTEVISGPDDLAGKTISRTNSAPQELSWPYFRDGHGYSEGDITVEGGSEEGLAAQLAQGGIDGVYDTISDYTAIQGQTDVEVGFMPLWNVAQIYGYPLFVNTQFLEDRGTDYMADVMTGYSKAAKWVLLNPGETVDIMIESVNPDLQTIEREGLMNEMRAAVVAVNTTQTTKENGFGYLDTDVLEQTIEVVQNGTDIDVSIDELAETEIQENADLATFSDDEWQQVTEFTGEFGEFFD